jgi:hypothetical protein
VLAPRMTVLGPLGSLVISDTESMGMTTSSGQFTTVDHPRLSRQIVQLAIVATGGAVRNGCRRSKQPPPCGSRSLGFLQPFCRME